MEEKYLKNFMLPVTILVLLALSFLILKPLVISISFGLLVAYIFYPFYLKLHKKITSKNICAAIILLINILIIIVPLVILTPLFIKELLQAYSSMKVLDISAVIFKIFPSLGSSDILRGEITSTASYFNSAISNLILNLFKNTIMNIPSIVFAIIIFLFTFFFGLKGGEDVKQYLSVLFALPREYEERFYKKFDQVTNSVVYGYLVVGLVQGIVAGIGYYMFGIPNALILTVLTTIIGIIPIIGPWLVWIPLDIYLFMQDSNGQAMQLLIYGLFVINWIETILRPQIISKKADMNPALALIGAIGGVYAFGVMGFVFGPLIIAYLILVIEIYKDKKDSSLILRDVKEESKG